MRAVVLDEQGVRFTADYPEPKPAAGEVRVKVLQAGICETDLQLMQGYMGFQGVLGHEFVGIACEGIHAGKRVVGEINCFCGNCDFCRAGMGNHCPHRSVLGILNHDGAFADQITLPERNLHLVPDAISTEDAVLTEPLAAAFEIPTQVSLPQGQRVLVLGDGRLGNLCSQVLRLQGCRVLAVGKHSEKLARLEALGLPTLLLSELPRDEKFPLVVDCTGSANGLPIALSHVQPRGTVILKTTIAKDYQLPLASIVIDEIQLLGSRCGPFAPALDALKNREVDVHSLISARCDLASTPEALQRAASEPVLKILLNVNAE